jgi:acyl-coenzyme A thioesterase PaaI-like protein
LHLIQPRVLDGSCGQFNHMGFIRQQDLKKNLLPTADHSLFSRMKELPHTHSCFVCGESNPLGLKLRFETDGRIVQARFHPRPEHMGFKKVVHGGLIATVLDEIMVWACAVQTRQFAFCAELNVRFLNPLTPGDTVLVTGELAANRKGRIFEAKAAARNSQGQKFAEATGKYLPVKTADVSEMLTDVVGDMNSVLGQPARPKA